MPNIIKTFSAIILFMFIFINAVAFGSAAPTPTQPLSWSWRKHFNNAGLKNLAMAWNGTRIAFSVTESGTKAGGGDVLVALDENGKPLRDWRVPGRVTRLSLNGKGSSLLVELASGKLLMHADWQSGKRPVSIKTLAPGAVLSPEGDFIAARTAGKGGAQSSVLSPEGKTLWSFAEAAEKELWKTTFPFLNKKKTIARSSASGGFALYEESSLLWKAELPGKPISIASSFLEGGLIAVSTEGEKGEIRFYGMNGTLTGSAPFPGGAYSLACADIGVACAALGNGPSGQRLSFFSQDGKELWTYTVDGQARAASSVAVAGQGELIIAGFEEKGQWFLRAWNLKGKPLWNAFIEGGLADFKVSWSGNRIAALTNDGRIVFFDTTPKQEKAK